MDPTPRRRRKVYSKQGGRGGGQSKRLQLTGRTLSTTVGVNTTVGTFYHPARYHVLPPFSFLMQHGC